MAGILCRLPQLALLSRHMVGIGYLACRVLFDAVCLLQPYPDEAHRCWALPPAFDLDLGLGIFTIEVMCCID